MNILFLTQVLPYPLDAGPKIRSYYTLRYLAKNNAISLLSFVRSSDSRLAIDHLRSFCNSVQTVPMSRSRWRDGIALFQSMLMGLPFLIVRDEVMAMDRQIKEIVRENHFDLIHADQLWMAPYALKARSEASRIGYTPKVVLDQHNAVFLIPERMANATKNPIVKLGLLRESNLMTKYEIDICHRFDQVTWVTKEDLDSVTTVNPIKKAGKKEDLQSKNEIIQKSTVIPICVNPSENVKVSHLPAAHVILFLGGMHWPPNADGATWFAREVFPFIVNKLPSAIFYAVGKQPPEILNTLGSTVKAAGFIENVDSFWNKARVFVVPLRSGGGMRVKILDAWAKGIPIVSTTIGAEGIAYSNGKDILIADSPLEFADAVIRVLSDDDLAQRMSIAGSETLAKCYDWEKIYPLWDKVYGNNLK